MVTGGPEPGNRGAAIEYSQIRTTAQSEIQEILQREAPLYIHLRKFTLKQSKTTIQHEYR